MPEQKTGYVAYLDLNDLLAEVEHLHTQEQLGAHPTLRLQALSTHIRSHGAMEITTSLVLTLADGIGQVHLARLELEMVEVWGSHQRKERDAQMEHAEQAMAVLRTHIAQRLPYVRLAGGVHSLPGMWRDVREVHTSQGLFAVVSDRPGEPNAPRSLKVQEA